MTTNDTLSTLATSEQMRIIEIMIAVEKATGVSTAGMTGGRRTARIAHARHLAMAVIRKATSLSLMEVGDLFNRDHGTVIHAIRAVSNRITTCAETKATYEKLTTPASREF
jgi:chromosomal replication initiator protein